MTEDINLKQESKKGWNPIRSLRDKWGSMINGDVDQTRRNFIKTGLMAAAAVPVLKTPGANTLADLAESADQQNLETEEDKSPVVTEFIDFTYGDPKPLIHQVLGDEDRSNDLGVGSEEFKSQRSKFILSGKDDVVKTAMLAEILEERKGHGKLTTGTFDRVARNNISNIETPHISPLENALTTSFTHDELGNVVAKVSVETSEIAQMIQKLPPELTVVNLSLVVGTSLEKIIFRRPKELPRFEFIDAEDEEATFYTLEEQMSFANVDGKLVPVNSDGKPLEILTEAEWMARNQAYQESSIKEYQQTGKSEGIETITSVVEGQEGQPIFFHERIEAYNESLATENLMKLIHLARQFPDRTFMCAGGNENSNFYWNRNDIQEKGEVWPENLLIIGGKHTSHNRSEVEADGCDIYLESSDFSWLNDGGVISSSEATAVVSSYANILDDKLKSKIPDASERAGKVRRILREALSENSTYRAHGIVGRDEEEDVTRQCKILRPELFKNIVESL